MDRVFRSAVDAIDHVSLSIPAGVFASEIAMPLPLQVASAGFRVRESVLAGILAVSTHGSFAQLLWAL